MSDPREILSRIRSQANAATEGPWAPWLDQDGTPHMNGLLMVGNADAVLPEGESWIEGIDVNPIAHTYTPEDREFIAESRTTTPKLLDSVEDALELHRPTDVEVIPWDCGEGECDHEDDEHPTETVVLCEECYRLALDVYPYYGENGCSAVLWPCPTVTAITDPLERKHDD